jgi:hypothetical protein
MPPGRCGGSEHWVASPDRDPEPCGVSSFTLIREMAMAGGKGVRSVAMQSITFTGAVFKVLQQHGLV